MKYLGFMTLLLAFTLNSCTTTMSVEEKSQWLMDYRKIAAREMDAEIAANPDKDPKPIIKRHNARYTKASEDAAHNFQAGVGQSLILKQDKFINKRYHYEVEARSQYNKRLINSLYKLRKKMKNSRDRKTNSPK